MVMWHEREKASKCERNFERQRKEEEETRFSGWCYKTFLEKNLISPKLKNWIKFALIYRYKDVKNMLFLSKSILLNCLLLLKWPVLVVSVFRGNLDFLDLFPKKFYNIYYWRWSKFWSRSFVTPPTPTTLTPWSLLCSES